jgi:carbamoyltransferase
LVAVVRPVDPSLHFSLRELFPRAEVAVVEHHLAHAASAFFASPFEKATVLTLDHTGDFGCGARWNAQGNQLQLEKEWQYPDSLAWLYSAVTELLGYRAGADEHKVQWLSTSGSDRFRPFHERGAIRTPRRHVLRWPSQRHKACQPKLRELRTGRDSSGIPAIAHG